MSKITALYNGFNSVLSLQPLVHVLKKMIAEGKPGARKVFSSLIDELESKPYLLEPQEDPAVYMKDAELVESLLSSIFPPSTTSNEGIYAISFPFKPDIVYASPAFRRLFLVDQSNEIHIPDARTSINVSKAGLSMAFDVIQKKFYSLTVPLFATSVHPFTDPETGLTKYYELRLNAQFVDVKCIGKDYNLPVAFNPQHTLDLEELKELFPMEHFRFEGLVVIDVLDVTQEQVIIEIKNTLLEIDAFSNVEMYDQLQQHVQSLIGMRHIRIGITPFFKKNDYYLYTEAHYRNSLLFRNKEVIDQKDRINELARAAFRKDSQPMLYEKVDSEAAADNQLLRYYTDQGIRSLILCPLTADNGQLLGLLEIASETDGQLQFQHLTRIQPAIQLFELALAKTNESLEMMIDRTIKEHFTAVQPAVEWKFTEAAFNYLQHRQVSDLAKMPPIAFEDVFPLFGAIDIRNSSTERNVAIQQDILEQLNMAKDVLATACRIMEFPILDEMQFKLDKFIASASDALMSDDEIIIYDFLQNDLDAVLRNLKATKPELKKTIKKYFDALDPQRKIIYRQRAKYEESITRINDVLDRFIDQEQQTAQEIYPHYFERYITDGVEFNIYIGQAITPQIPFNEMYVRNLKLWQLSMLARAARLSHALEKRLPLALQTTQLILAHSIPLTISFRRKERKFDVDGAYNIRYEIVKKRIDKVYIRDTDERLTQPGLISIVYSHAKERTEYMDYIEFLQHENILGKNVEDLELEDTQGISGLKAIRVDINLESESTATHHEVRKVAAANDPDK
ncbi:MAG TPA: hypothetical protein VFZ78_06195 [Flavisolibacter sp.]